MKDIQVIPNGPYAIDLGAVRVVTLSGEERKPPEGQKIFLCRCGQSSNKPFCDGTHRKVGFKAD
jgi:CDGSH-type Zn-finger protein